MTPTQARKEIDNAINELISKTSAKEAEKFKLFKSMRNATLWKNWIISKTEKDKAEKLRQAYEVIKKDYQDKINLCVIRTDHSLYL
tara:strand:- start:76 stop:333 length:258 start_codon:yes stop_codon:yes gene_type:complete